MCLILVSLRHGWQIGEVDIREREIQRMSEQRKGSGRWGLGASEIGERGLPERGKLNCAIEEKGEQGDQQQR